MLRPSDIAVQYLLLSTLSSAYLWSYFLLILHYSTAPGKMQLDCGSWIRWLLSRIRSCADKLGGVWKRDELQRAATRMVTAKMMG